MNIRWQLQRASNGWEGTIIIPAGIASCHVKAKGKSKAEALSRAAALADSISANPILAAVLPPQAALALKATKALAKSAAAGQLVSAAKTFVGPGMKRLGKVLGF